MSHIFVSYSRQSKQIVDTLVDDLKGCGKSVWFDLELSGAQLWWNQILEKVRDCDFFKFVLCEESLHSVACNREFQYADDLGKSILPVLVDKSVSINLLPPALSKINYIDFTNPQNRNTLRQLIKAINILPKAQLLPNPLPLEPKIPVSQMGNLYQRVQSNSDLNKAQQSELLLDIKQSLRKVDNRKDALRILEKFGNRDDLLAVTKREVDEVLEVEGARIESQSTNNSKSDTKSGDSNPRLELELEDKLLNARAKIMQLESKISHLANSPNQLPVSVSHPDRKLSKHGDVQLIRIPSGEFDMGSMEEGDEQPIHRVKITTFFMSKFPITNTEYGEFVQANTTVKKPEFWNEPPFNGRLHPVVGVSWGEACAFAKWAGGRLPTESEWEYAASAGANTRYWWGAEVGENNTNCVGSGSRWSGKSTSPVGSFNSNSFGLHEMSGNIWEWVQDCWHDNYKYAPEEGQAWLEENAGDCNSRVARGGSWGNTADGVRSANRVSFDPDSHYLNLGFRIVQDK